MIIVVKTDLGDREVQSLVKWIEKKNIKVKATEGENRTILGLVGDTSQIDIDAVKSYAVVDEVLRVQEPYKQASRKFKPTDTVVDINGIKLGGGNFQVIAGPCSVESERQILSIADSVKRSGARLLRGGAFKPRTSPYAFQGLHATGIEYLSEAKRATGMPIVSEIMSEEHLSLFNDVDVIQVGARNMQNFELLKVLGKTNKVILLKRGLSSTIDELLMSAEYILAGGNSNVILCERGIRTFETATRNTLDVSAIAVLKKRTHLPVIVDPSHSGGYSEYVESLSLAAAAAGADGLIVEVHNDPKNALCDGAQSLTPEAFDKLMRKVNPLRRLLFQLDLQTDDGDAEYSDRLIGAALPYSPKKGAKVACFGAEDAYSGGAAAEMFVSPFCDYFKSFKEVFAAVDAGNADYGVVPIENSTAGSVVEVYDLLSRYGLSIVAEKVMKIDHSLLSAKPMKASEVKTVYSHPQALYQCRGFLEKMGVKTVETASTAEAAKIAAESEGEGAAAIASLASKDKYHLSAIETGIQDAAENYTRFIAVSKKREVAADADKLSMLFVLEHKQNALLNVLSLFGEENINLLKLESRPVPGRNFEMMFYADMDGSIKNNDIKRISAKLGRVTAKAKLLGCYKRSDVV